MFWNVSISPKELQQLFHKVIVKAFLLFVIMSDPYYNAVHSTALSSTYDFFAGAYIAEGITLCSSYSIVKSALLFCYTFGSHLCL